MPEYLFENPETGEVISVIQGIDEEHTYSEEGKKVALDNLKLRDMATLGELGKISR